MQQGYSYSNLLYNARCAMGFAWMVTPVMRISCTGRCLASTGTFSMASSVPPYSAPSITLPKMVYLPSRWGCLL